MRPLNATTKINSLFAAFAALKKASVLTQRQIELFHRYLELLIKSPMAYSTRGLGSSALDALTKVSQMTLTSTGLPDDQWQVETELWFRTALARIQIESVRYASKDYDLSPEEYLNMPEDDWMCKTQLIKLPTGYQNFSVLGICIIVIVSFTIISLSLFIDKLIFWFYRHLSILAKYKYKRSQYIADSLPQLQRQAFEGAGSGNWTGHTKAFPTTKGWNQKLCLFYNIGLAQELKFLSPNNENGVVVENIG